MLGDLLNMKKMLVISASVMMAVTACTNATTTENAEVQPTSVEQSVEVPTSYCEELVTLAENGNEEAEYKLGMCYYGDGLGVSQDYSKALKWFTRAAEHGNADAALCLVVMYGEGKGVSKDISTAIKWLKQSAALGNSEGQLMLAATVYLDEEGPLYDREEGIRWMRKAAANGNEIAKAYLKQNNL